jgi:hypothetical protein
VNGATTQKRVLRIEKLSFPYACLGARKPWAFRGTRRR